MKTRELLYQGILECIVQQQSSWFW